MEYFEEHWGSAEFSNIFATIFCQISDEWIKLKAELPGTEHASFRVTTFYSTTVPHLLSRLTVSLGWSVSCFTTTFLCQHSVYLRKSCVTLPQYCVFLLKYFLFEGNAYSILFHSLLFYSILFYFILLMSIMWFLRQYYFLAISVKLWSLIFCAQVGG